MEHHGAIIVLIELDIEHLRLDSECLDRLAERKYALSKLRLLHDGVVILDRFQHFLGRRGRPRRFQLMQAPIIHEQVLVDLDVLDQLMRQTDSEKAVYLLVAV